MILRLINVVTWLSLLLSLAACGMWARSRFVTEGWEFRPRPSANAHAGEGWHKHRVMESGGGRLVFVEYDGFVRAADPPVGGYHQFAEPLTPVRHNRRIRAPHMAEIPAPTIYGQIPGLAEWSSIPKYAYLGAGRFVAVSWPAIAAAFALLPIVRILRYWRRWRQSRLPAFPVKRPDG